MATAAGTTDYKTYYITSGHAAAVDAIRGESGNQLTLIDMSGGSLDANAEATVKVMGGEVKLTAGELSGSISGATLSVSGGTLAAILSGNNTLVGAGYTLSGELTNTGTLTLSGTFTVNSLTTNEAATFIGADGVSGFAKDAYKVATIATGTTADAGATITYNGEELKLNTNGTASAGGTVHYDTFWLKSDVAVESDAIHTLGDNALVDITAGKLTVNDETRVKANGGSIVLDGGVLNGSLTCTELTLKAGTVNATITDGQVTGDSYALSEILQVSGNVSISGSFVADNLHLTTEGSTRVDVVTGNSGNSGFLKQGDSYVQIINGGVLTIDGVTVSHQDAATPLILGNDGYARSTGGTNYGEYLLTGSDRVSTQQIHFGAGAGACVRQEGGMLTVNDATTVKTTRGEIVLSDATLRGEVSDARVTAEGGCIAATLGGITAVTITGEVSMSGNNSHGGVTTLADGNLTITHAQALGSGDIVSTGASKLVVDGVTLVLGDTITNTGTLTLSGSIDASALQLNKTEAGRLSLSGERVGLTESGFSQGVEYTVLIVDGGSTVNAGAGISHKDYLSRTQLVLGEDGVARAGAEVDYTHYFLTGGDSAEVSKIAEVSAQHQAELNGVTMDRGLLTVDQSITVSATGGSIQLTKAATLGGVIEDTAVSSAAGDYVAEISARMEGDSTLNIGGGTITVSGDNSYTGGTTVNGGTLVAGNGQAFGTGDVVVNNATLDLYRFSIANKVVMKGSSTLGNADGASHIVLGSGAAVNFLNGYTQSGGKRLVVEGSASYTGALTLGGGTLELDGLLTVRGDVEFASGATTTLDISGWDTAGDGTVLVDFGSANSGYTDDCLTLSGIAGDWELDFDTASGVLTLVAVKDDFRPNLDRNQQEAYDTVKDIMADTNPRGGLGELMENIIGTRNEAELKRALDEISGREYATIMSSQIEGNLGHLRRLRTSAGKGTPLGEYVTFGCCYPSNKGVDKSDNKGATVMMAQSPVLDSRRIRAGVSAFHEQGEIESDSNGDGFERSETGAQLTLEYLVTNDFSLGLGISQSRTSLTPAYGKRRHEDNTHFDLFGVYQSGSWSSTTAVGIGLHRHELGRVVAGMQTNAETDGFSVNFLQELACTVWSDKQQGLQVFGAVESSFNQVDAFSESGAGNASLRVEEQEAWATDITLGLRYSHALPALSKAPAGTFALQTGVVASLGDVSADTTMRFAGAPEYSYSQYAAERSRWGYSVGASVNLPVSASTAVFGTVDTVLHNNSYTVDAQLGLKIAF